LIATVIVLTLPSLPPPRETSRRNALRLVNVHMRCGHRLLFIGGCRATYRIDEGEAVRRTIPGCVVPAVLDRE
jgi:hypothetical protein